MYFCHKCTFEKKNGFVVEINQINKNYDLFFKSQNTELYKFFKIKFTDNESTTLNLTYNEIIYALNSSGNYFFVFCTYEKKLLTLKYLQLKTDITIDLIKNNNNLSLVNFNTIEAHNINIF